MEYVCNKETVIMIKEVVSVIDHLVAESPHGESPCTKDFCLSLTFGILNKFPISRFSIKLQANIMKWLRVGRS